jgi:hypothetical protein
MPQGAAHLYVRQLVEALLLDLDDTLIDDRQATVHAFALGLHTFLVDHGDEDRTLLHAIDAV